MKDNLSLPTYNIKPGLNKTWPAYILLMVSLFITIFGWNISNGDLNTKLQNLFEIENAKIINRLNMGIDRQIEVLRSLQSLYINNVQIVKDVFELFAAVPVKMYDGIQSISYAPHIIQGQENFYEELVRNEGYPDYKIKPTGTRTEYYPIEYVVPFDKNDCASSFDIFSIDRRREAIEKAINNNIISSSHLVNLLCTKEPGFLLVAPIYMNDSKIDNEFDRRRNIKGVCFIELNAQKFIKSVLGKDIDSSTISFDIYDGSGMTSSSLIYTRETSKNPLLQSQKTINVAGHDWVIVFSSLPEFASDLNKNMPWFILTGGLALSFLLFGFTYSLLTSRSRAVDIAERITRSQRRIVDSSQDLISIVGFDGKLKSMNPASKTVLGYDPQEMIDKPLLSFIHPSDRKTLYKTITDGNDEHPMSVEARHFDSKGKIIWIHWSITTSNRDQMIYMIGRDITEKKKSEKQIGFKNRQLELANVITDRENFQNEEFFKNQSLEFRTQLTSIAGFLQILTTDTGNLTGEELEFLKMAFEGSQNLLELVKNMLDSNRMKITDVTFTFSTFEIGEIINHVEKLTKDLSTVKGVNLLIKTPLPDAPKVSGDPKKLIQAIAILTERILENHKSGNIRLKANPMADSDFMEITLSDSGLDEIPDIFLIIDPNVKKTTLDDRAFSVFIAKSFIDVMGGTLAFEINSEGLTLTIRIPLAS